MILFYRAKLYERIDLNMKIYGYARVSSADQNEDRQLVALQELNIDVNNI